MLDDHGGSGVPLVLLHGLMGGPDTWRRQVPWLREHGHVLAARAAGHGRAAPATLTTEAFVDELREALAPFESVILIGHSMGALHAWCLAAREPDRVRGIVVEDMAPDFRGRTSDGWAAVIRAWPQPFPDEAAVLAYFGDVAGQYFLDSFERTPDGLHLHGDVDTFAAISDEWGRRDFWDEWRAVRAPALLLEAEHTVTPAGQMARMAALHHDSTYEVVAGAGHLVHDDRPGEYRCAVESFLRALPGEREGAGGRLLDEPVDQ
ncbi:alpha/beta fold hydrolase [Rhodococcus sp. NBC_00297]|uniref:alpha/beta fold hydrolase n=1 Tax=Rhodococcus sp. NBC_00297 TaxID=2976005 RepID=UPI002E2DFA25|nr:alpha/beta hydrolase [Rhodococcus sp. NBC_00297]